MVGTSMPHIKTYIDKYVDFKLNGNRKVSGILRGFDPFMNLVIDETLEIHKDGKAVPIGMVVIRGNSIVSMEPRERVS